MTEYSMAPEGYGKEWQSENRPPSVKRKRKKPVFLVVFLLVQLLFIVWIVAGIASASGTPDDCYGLSNEECNDAEAAGAGIAVFAIIFFWMLVDVIMGVTYGVYKLATRKN